MLVIAAAVFLVVFLIVAVVLSALGFGSEQIKQTLARFNELTVPRQSSGDDVIEIRRQELLSTLPWFNRILLRFNAAAHFKLLLYQAGLPWTVGRLVLFTIAFGVCALYAVYWRTGNPIIAVLLGSVAAAGPILYVYTHRARRFAAFEQRLPEALDLMVSALRAGHSLNSAFGLVAKECSPPISTEFRQCFDEQNFGLELRSSMMSLVTRVPISDMRMIVTAILIQKETGGNLAQILERVAAVIRDRFRIKRQIRVHTAQARLTGAILALLPIVLGVGLYLLKPERMSILWTHPVGLKILIASIVLTMIGVLIIRKIIQVRV